VGTAAELSMIKLDTVLAIHSRVSVYIRFCHGYYGAYILEKYDDNNNVCNNMTVFNVARRK